MRLWKCRITFCSFSFLPFHSLFYSFFLGCGRLRTRALAGNVPSALLFGREKDLPSAFWHYNGLLFKGLRNFFFSLQFSVFDFVFRLFLLFSRA
jgi:hypothetical protein